MKVFSFAVPLMQEQKTASDWLILAYLEITCVNTLQKKKHFWLLLLFARRSGGGGGGGARVQFYGGE